MGLIGKIFVKLGLDNSEFKQGLGGANKEGNVFAQGFKKIGGILAGVFAAESIVRFGKELLELRNKTNAVRAAFDALNKPTLLNELRAATNGTINDLDLMRRAVMANNFKLPLEQLATYFEFASMRARETGQSVDYLVESIVTGLARESVMILDNLGISALEIRKNMEGGATMAKAVADIINRELSKGNRVIADSVSKTDQLSASWKNFKMTIAEGWIGQTVSGFGTMLQNQMNAITNLFGGRKQAKIDLINKQDNDQAKAWMANINNVKEAESELSRVRRKEYKWAAEVMYEQMLKEYVQREKLNAQQKIISNTTIDGINKQIEALNLLAAAETDKAKQQSYFDEIERLTKKVTEMQMSSSEKAKAAAEAAKQALIAEAEATEGTILSLEKKISLLQQDIDLTNDESKRAAMNQELANLKYRLEVMQKTTQELRDYNALIARAGTALPSVTNNITGQITTTSGSAKATMDKANAERLQAQLDKTKEVGKELKEQYTALDEMAVNFNQKITESISSGIQTLVEGLVATGKVDAGSVVRALVSPFGDMLIQLGEVAIGAGIGLEAIKDSLSSMQGFGAIAAGVAMVALGAAVKAGVANIGKNMGRSAGPSTGYTGGSTFAKSVTPTADLQVVSVLKGEDIWLMNQKVQQRKGR